MELDKSNIIINSCIGMEHTQILVEGDVIVPDSKPDMEMLLCCNATACIDNYDIINQRLSVKGAVNIEMLYLSEGGEQNVHSMEGEGAINDFINIKGIDENSLIIWDYCLTELQCKKINERKASYRAVIEFKAYAYNRININPVRNIEDIPKQQQIKEYIAYTDIVYSGREKITVKDELKLDGAKPNIQDILSLRLNIINKECYCNEDTLNVTGDIKTVMLYKGENESKPVEIFEGEMPLKATIQVDNVNQGMNCCVQPCIKNIYYNILPDEDGENRLVEIEAEICMYITVRENKECEVLRDAYCLNCNTVIDWEDITLERQVCTNKSQCPVKESISLDENAPDMLQIMVTNGRACIDNLEIMENKTLVEGVIQVSVLYVTQDDKMPIYCYKDNIPFKHIGETRGTCVGMQGRGIVNAEHIGVNMISDRQVEIRCMLDIELCINEQADDKYINDISFVPLTQEQLNNMAGIVVYTVKPGDTLWCLAKKFNTTVQDIVEINDIDNPDLIYPGERFIIVKRV